MRGAIASHRALRAATAALYAAGAVPGQVVLPPDGVDSPYGLSPICTVMSRGSRPNASATQMASTVRAAVPKSCVEHCVSTEPSGLMVTRVKLLLRPAPPQV